MLHDFGYHFNGLVGREDIFHQLRTEDIHQLAMRSAG